MIILNLYHKIRRIFKPECYWTVGEIKEAEKKAKILLEIFEKKSIIDG